jgi:hypothetical protein
MKRVLALSALLYGGHAGEDAATVCRLGEEFAEDGTPCQADGDVLLQTRSKIHKHNPGEEGEPPAEASQNMELRS